MEKNKNGQAPVKSGNFRRNVYIGNWRIALKTREISFCSLTRKMLELCGKKEEGLNAILSIVPPEKRRELIREFKFALASGSNLDYEIKVVTINGKEKWIHVTGVLSYKDWNNAEEMIGTIEDITQKKTEECAGLAIFNHELRTPLTVIKLTVQKMMSMLSGIIDNSSFDSLKRINTQVTSIARLMDEYLTFSPNEQRQVNLNDTLFDLNQLIETTINEVRALHPCHQFYKLSSLPLWVKADKFKIIRVLINYLTNAVKFSPKASLITIKTLINHNHVEVAIADQGMGIADDQQQKIFQKFYRSEHHKANPGNSKGLGLYLVKEIIQQHGGTVRAENSSDKGSIFYFTLPLANTGI